MDNSDSCGRTIQIGSDSGMDDARDIEAAKQRTANYPGLFHLKYHL